MNIYDAINKLPFKKMTYFKWKHDLFVREREGKETAEHLAKRLGLKTLDSLKKWEKTEEYLDLVNLYLESRFANDLEKMYTVTATKALEGDEKSIKLLLDLQKQIRSFNKETKPTAPIKEQIYDDLEL